MGLYAHHSHHVICKYGDEPVGSRRGTLQALFCGPERITEGLEPGEHPSERSGAITTLFWATESMCTRLQWRAIRCDFPPDHPRMPGTGLLLLCMEALNYSAGQASQGASEFAIKRHPSRYRRPCPDLATRLHDFYIMRGSSKLTAFLGRGFAVDLSKLGNIERQVT